MSVSFLRIDDRMIHGQTVTRWSLEYPCDGLIAVNDKAATTDALKMAYKSASTKKTFVWTYEAWKKKNGCEQQEVNKMENILNMVQEWDKTFPQRK